MKLRLGICLMILSLNSCSTSHYEALPTGNVGRLTEIEDFTLAKKYAPKFSKEALLTVNSLEYQNKIKK